MSNPTVFDDGSSIEWVDKETLRYIEGGSSALIWVDFEPGLFSGGRIIRSSSIKEWEHCKEADNKMINERKKQEIIKKVEKYYGIIGKACRVES